MPQKKKYLNCSRQCKYDKKQRIQAEMYTSGVTEFCNRMGLQIDQLVLRPLEARQEEQDEEIEEGQEVDEFQLQRSSIIISVIEKPITNDQKSFKGLNLKDEINMSDRKYELLRSSLKEFNPISLPGIDSVKKLKYQLNHYFNVKENENKKGFYVDPEKKIIFVCKKFLEKNNNFQKNKFRIKIAADSSNISSTHLTLLILAFSLLDDIKTATSVHGCYALGLYMNLKKWYNNSTFSLIFL
jgi:hypothetical protein